MSKPFIPLFLDWIEVTRELNAQEKGRLVDAIVIYARGGDWQDQIKGNERYLFPAFQGQLDRAAEISEIRARATESRRNQTKSNEIKTDQTQSNDIKNDNYNKNNNKNKNKNENSNVKRFSPPTRDEVAAYIAEKGYHVDPDQWLAHYESNGWRVGQNPMKDWKAAVRTWTQNRYDTPKGRTVAAQQYTQRDYSQMPEHNDLLDLFTEGAG